VKSAVVSIIVSVALIAAVVVVGYALLPKYVAEITAEQTARTVRLAERMDAAERFIESEQAARKASALPPDANSAVIATQVNHLLGRVTALEQALAGVQSQWSVFQEEQKKQLDTTATSLLAEIAALRTELTAVAKGTEEAREARLKKIVAKIDSFGGYFVIEDVRTHLLKAKSDLLAENLGNARGEIQQAVRLFNTLEEGVRENPAIKGAALTLERLETDIAADPPSGIARIDLLWRDLGRLIQKQSLSEEPETAPEKAPEPAETP